MKKQLYEQPLAEIFGLNLQRNVLQSVSPNANWSSNPGGVSGTDSYDEGNGMEGF